MRKRIHALGIDFERFRGFDGSRGEHLAVSRYDERATLWNFGHKLNAGEIACFASHYALWQQCVELDEPLLVLEDDVQLALDFRKAAEFAMEQAGSLGFIHLVARHRERDWPTVTERDGMRILLLPKGHMGTQCYVISPWAARQLIDQAERWDAPVDYFMASAWRHHVRSHGMSPPVAFHEDPGHNASDIGARESYRVLGPRDVRRFLSRQRHSVRRRFYNALHAT